VKRWRWLAYRVPPEDSEGVGIGIVFDSTPRAPFELTFIFWRRCAVLYYSADAYDRP